MNFVSIECVLCDRQYVRPREISISQNIESGDRPYNAAFTCPTCKVINTIPITRGWQLKLVHYGATESGALTVADASDWATPIHDEIAAEMGWAK